MKKSLHLIFNNYILIADAAVFIAACIFIPNFTKPGNLYTLLQNICVYGIVALGTMLIMITGTIDFSVGFLVANVSIVACLSINRFGFITGLIFSFVFGCIISIFNGAMINRLKINPLIITLGTMMILRGIGTAICNAADVICLDPALASLFTCSIGGIIPLSLICLAIVFFLVVILLKRTVTGTNLFVIGTNYYIGHINGILVERVRIFVFLLAGIFYSIGGLFWASRMNSGSISIGDNLMLLILSSCVIGGTKISGGKGNPLSVLLGVFLIQTINNMMSLLALPVSLQMLITGVVLIISLSVERLLRPKYKRRGIG